MIMNIIDLSQLNGLVLSENPMDDTLETTPEIPNDAPMPAQKKLRIWLERQKGGRVATVVRGWEDVTDAQLTDFAKMLKTKLATGGAAKGGEISLQGDVRTNLLLVLAKLGHTAKQAGG